MEVVFDKESPTVTSYDNQTVVWKPALPTKSEPT